MKVFRKTHTNNSTLQKQIKTIKERGGIYEVNGMKVKYYFPTSVSSYLKYDTIEKRVKTIKKEGNILTFKKPFNWMGQHYTQILVKGFQKQNGSVKIIGLGRDSEWYKNMDDLINAINWDLMEEWHS